MSKSKDYFDRLESSHTRRRNQVAEIVEENLEENSFYDEEEALRYVNEHLSDHDWESHFNTKQMAAEHYLRQYKKRKMTSSSPSIDDSSTSF